MMTYIDTFVNIFDTCFVTPELILDLSLSSKIITEKRGCFKNLNC